MLKLYLALKFLIMMPLYKALNTQQLQLKTRIMVLQMVKFSNSQQRLVMTLKTMMSKVMKKAQMIKMMMIWLRRMMIMKIKTMFQPLNLMVTKTETLKMETATAKMRMMMPLKSSQFSLKSSKALTMI